MCFYNFLCFNYMQLSVVIEESIESFKNFWGRQVQLIEDDPITVTHCLHQNTFLKDQFSCVSIWNIRAKILLNICVHMVVDPDNFVVCNLGQILDTGCFARRSWSFKNNGKVAYCNHACKLSKQVLKRGGEDEIFLIKVLWRAVSFGNHVTFNVDKSLILLVFRCDKFGKLLYFKELHNNLSYTLL